MSVNVGYSLVNDLAIFISDPGSGPSVSSTEFYDGNTPVSYRLPDGTVWQWVTISNVHVNQMLDLKSLMVALQNSASVSFPVITSWTLDVIASFASFNSSNFVITDLIPVGDVRYLNAKAFAGMGSTYVPYLSPALIGGMTAAQVAALGASDSAWSLSNLTAAQFQALSPAAISGATPSQLKALATTQLKAFTSAQMAALSPAQLVALGTPLNAELNADDPALGNAIVQPTAYTNPSLAPSTLVQQTAADTGLAMATSPWTTTSVAAADVTQLQPWQVWSMSASVIGAMGANVAKLPPAALIGLSPSQFAAVQAAAQGNNVALQQIPLTGANSYIPAQSLTSVSSSYIGQLQPGLLNQVSHSIFSSLSSTQLGALTATQVANLLPDQVASLTADDRARLLQIGTPVLTMMPDQISAQASQDHGGAWLAGLTPLVVGSMTPQQLMALGADLKSLSASQMAVLSASTLNVLSSAAWRQLLSDNAVAVNSLSSAELANLDPVVAQGLVKLQSSGIAPFDVTHLTVLKNAAAATFPDLVARNGPIRAVYSNATAVRTATAFMNVARNMLGISASFTPNVVGQMSMEVQHVTASFFQTLRGSIDFKADPNQAVRLIGSAFTLSAIANTIQSALKVNGNPTLVTQHVLQVAAFLSSALQVPSSYVINAFIAYNQSRRFSTGNANLDELLTGIELNTISVRAAEKEIAAAPSSYMPTDELATLNGKLAYRFSGVALAKASPFLIADLFGAANSAFQIYSAATSGNTGGVVLGSIGLVANVATLAGDAAPALLAASKSASFLSSALLTPAMVATVMVGDAATIYQDVQAYQKSQSTGTAIALAGDTFGAVVQASAIVAGTLVAGPVGATIGAMAGLLLPNFGSIGAAADLVTLQDNLAGQGRTVAANTICAPLLKIALLDAAPLIPLTGFIYRPIIEAQVLSAMRQSSGMALALTQDFQYEMKSAKGDGKMGNTATGTGPQVIAAFQGLIAGSAGTSQPISDVKWFSENSADEKSYWANADSAIDNYVAELDVTKSSYSATAFGLTRGSANSQVDAPTTQAPVPLASNGSGLELVELSRASSATIDLVVDARASTQSMEFKFDTDNITAYAGSGDNTALVDVNECSNVHFTGGTGGSNVVQMFSTSALSSATINLDQFLHASVRACSAVSAFTVTGTRSGQEYAYSGGPDSVKMTGGNGQAIVGGQGTKLIMGGGNNLAFVVMGARTANSGASQAPAGTYDGGATVAPTYDASGNMVATGENTINFSASDQSLNFNVNDPLGAASSSVSADDPVTDTQLDHGKFNNFENIVLSNMGDTFVANNANHLDHLVLGSGSNWIQMNNSSGFSISAGIGNGNKIWFNNSSGFIDSELGTTDIHLQKGSSVQAQLDGTSDVLDASNDGAVSGSALAIEASVGFGAHLLMINGQSAQVTEDVTMGGQGTTTIEDSSDRTNGLLISLASDASHEWVSQNQATGALTFWSKSTDGTGTVREIDYVAGSFSSSGAGTPLAFSANTASLASASNVQVVFAASVGSLARDHISVATLISGMAGLQQGGTAPTVNPTTGTSGYSLDKLVTYALNHASSGH